MNSYRTTVLVILTAVLSSCRAAPVPQEVLEAELQARDLRGDGASVFAAKEYEAYLLALREARRRFEAENLKLGWLRDYRPTRKDFQTVLEAGAVVERALTATKAQQSETQAERAVAVRMRLSTLEAITASLTVRGPAREALARSSLLLAEAEGLIQRDMFGQAAEKLNMAESLITSSEKAIGDFIGRYRDEDQVRVWQRWAEDTIAESRAKRITVLIVSKLEKKLMLYRNGTLVKTYSIGIGFNGLADKRHSGDNATPEGRYRIIKKMPVSQYYKALLINYPNEEDRKAFAQERQRGTIPKSVGIGGQIEIHGGGPDSLTQGCVSLHDSEMDDLFGRVAVGTPVTIVGMTEADNPILKAIRGH